MKAISIINKSLPTCDIQKTNVVLLFCPCYNREGTIMGMIVNWTVIESTTLDVMYIKKNICENVVQTIFGQNYTIKVQCDMQIEGIQQHLWLRLHSHNQHKILKPHVFCVLIVDELNIFLSRMVSMKLFINY
jgi:hypothetical protein